MVVGSDLYHVVVRIRKLGQVAWKAIRAECAGRVGSVLELLQGRLSDHVLRVVTDPDRGLFPKPGEITLTCDCPDWAVMCKHAAAVLYGVGSRLDDRPELLFRLRDVDAEDLVVGDMALPDASAGDDVLAGDLADIFGIDLDPAAGRGWSVRSCSCWSLTYAFSASVSVTVMGSLRAADERRRRRGSRVLDPAVRNAARRLKLPG